MLRVFEQDGYIGFFFSNEGTEPLHVHVRRSGKTAKFWLGSGKTVSCESSRLKPGETQKAARLVEDHYDEISKAWKEFKKKQG